MKYSVLTYNIGGYEILHELEYKDDDDEEITENTLDEIKAKLQKNLRAYPSYYRGYEIELE